MELGTKASGVRSSSREESNEVIQQIRQRLLDVLKDSSSVDADVSGLSDAIQSSLLSFSGVFGNGEPLYIAPLTFELSSILLNQSLNLVSSNRTSISLLINHLFGASFKCDPIALKCYVSDLLRFLQDFKKGRPGDVFKAFQNTTEHIAFLFKRSKSICFLHKEESCACTRPLHLSAVSEDGLACAVNSMMVLVANLCKEFGTYLSVVVNDFWEILLERLRTLQTMTVVDVESVAISLNSVTVLCTNCSIPSSLSLEMIFWGVFQWIVWRSADGSRSPIETAVGQCVGACVRLLHAPLSKEMISALEGVLALTFETKEAVHLRRSMCEAISHVLALYRSCVNFISDEEKRSVMTLYHHTCCLLLGRVELHQQNGVVEDVLALAFALDREILWSMGAHKEDDGESDDEMDIVSLLDEMEEERLLSQSRRKRVKRDHRPARPTKASATVKTETGPQGLVSLLSALVSGAVDPVVHVRAQKMLCIACGMERSVAYSPLSESSWRSERSTSQFSCDVSMFSTLLSRLVSALSKSSNGPTTIERHADRARLTELIVSICSAWCGAFVSKERREEDGNVLESESARSQESDRLQAGKEFVKPTRVAEKVSVLQHASRESPRASRRTRSTRSAKMNLSEVHSDGQGVVVDHYIPIRRDVVSFILSLVTDSESFRLSSAKAEWNVQFLSALLSCISSLLWSSDGLPSALVSVATPSHPMEWFTARIYALCMEGVDDPRSTIRVAAIHALHALMCAVLHSKSSILGQGPSTKDVMRKLVAKLGDSSPDVVRTVFCVLSSSCSFFSAVVAHDCAALVLSTCLASNSKTDRVVFEGLCDHLVEFLSAVNFSQYFGAPKGRARLHKLLFDMATDSSSSVRSSFLQFVHAFIRSELLQEIFLPQKSSERESPEIDSELGVPVCALGVLFSGVVRQLNRIGTTKESLKSIRSENIGADRELSELVRVEAFLISVVGVCGRCAQFDVQNEHRDEDSHNHRPVQSQHRSAFLVAAIRSLVGVFARDSSDVAVRSYCVDEIRMIAEENGFGVRAVFDAFSDLLYPYLFERVFAPERKEQRGIVGIRQRLEEVSCTLLLFGESNSLRSFILHVLKTILPYFVTRIDRVALALLDSLLDSILDEKEETRSVTEFVVLHLGPILCYLLTSPMADAGTFQRAMSFVTKITGTEPNVLFSMVMDDLWADLIWKMGDLDEKTSERAKTALGLLVGKMKASSDAEQDGGELHPVAFEELPESPAAVEFGRLHFIGVMDVLNSRLLDANAVVESHENALRSLKGLCELSSPEIISSFRPKIISTIEIFMKQSIVRGWSSERPVCSFCGQIGPFGGCTCTLDFTLSAGGSQRALAVPSVQASSASLVPLLLISLDVFERFKQNLSAADFGPLMARSILMVLPLLAIPVRSLRERVVNLITWMICGRENTSNNPRRRRSVHSYGPAIDPRIAQWIPEVHPAVLRPFAVLQPLIALIEKERARKFSDSIASVKAVEMSAEEREILLFQFEIKVLVSHVRGESPSLSLSAFEELKERILAHRAVLSFGRKRSKEISVSHRILSDTCGVLVDGIAVGMRSAKLEISLAAVEVLGLLGAIDPENINRNEREHEDREGNRSFSEFFDDSEFIKNFLRFRLAKAIVAASDTKAQDRTGFAVKETYRILEERFGREESVSDEADPILQPFLSWNYTWDKRDEGDTQDAAPKVHFHESLARADTPVFNPSEFSVEQWLTSWSLRLIYRAKGGRSSVFHAVKFVLQDDETATRSLLPFLCHNVVCSPTSERGDVEFVRMEMMAVLGWGAQQAQREMAAQFGPLAKGWGIGIDSRTSFESIERASGRELVAVEIIFDLYDGIVHILRASQLSPPSSFVFPSGWKMHNYETLCDSIPHRTLALAALAVSSFSRALYHIELAIREKKMEFSRGDFVILQQILLKMGDIDAVEGVAVLRKEATLQEQILDFESQREWNSAMDCYDALSVQQPKSLSHHEGVLRCLKQMGRHQSMLVYLKGLLSRAQDFDADETALRRLHRHKAAVVWRMGLWDDLNELTQKEGDDKEEEFEIHLGRALVSFREREMEHVREHCRNARVALLQPLRTLSTSSYARFYPLVVQCAMLTDIENSPAADQEFYRRLNLSSPSFAAREPLVTLRCRLLQLSGTDPASERISSLWLNLAKLARCGGLLQTAFSTLVRANTNSPTLHIERARLHWTQGNVHQALVELQEHGQKENRVVHAKTLLLMGKWLEATGQKNSKELIAQYSNVAQFRPDWDKGYFFLARYYDTVLHEQLRNPMDPKENFTHKPLDDESKAAAARSVQNPYHYLPLIILNYGLSLKFGTQFVYQALPRMLTLWFDFGLTVANSSSNRSAAEDLALCNQYVAQFSGQLPTKLWLVVFSQLTSRITHKHPDVLAVLEKIILNCLLSYPHHSLWYIVSVLYTKKDEQRKRSREVIQKAQKKRPDLLRIFKQFSNFTTALIESCNRDMSGLLGRRKECVVQMEKEFKKLYDCGPLDQLMLPTLHALSNPPVQPYSPDRPHGLVTIVSFQQDVKVFRSLCCPRRIGILGSDGSVIYFLAKPKDDLRKDQRLMELCTMLNILCERNAETRSRRMHVRTFAAIPLSEEVGLVEWVLDTTPFRTILRNLYAKKEKRARERKESYLPILEDREIQKLYSSESSMKPLDRYQQVLLPRFPPIFHQWFVDCFGADPSGWVAARTAYTRTTAFMSILGYILGLGDRHTENLLFDTKSGEIVHVDFSCLFFRGLRLKEPERVPFRLTPNLVDAFGVTGYEGGFRRACELTLTVLRANRESLMSVLETFIFDPLVEWSNKRRSKDSKINPEEAAIHGVERRLQGMMEDALPLSEKGQVHHLIEEATNQEHLALMYIGWKAWM